MTSRTKKMTVFHLLAQKAEPVGLKDILSELGTAFPERSVRRWLAEMVKTGHLKRSGEKRGTQYQVSQRNEFPSPANNRCFSAPSLRVIEQVRRPFQERAPVAYEEQWLHAYKPNTTFYLPLNVREQLHQAGKRSKQEADAGTYARQIFNRLLIDLSYNSSRLEGNTYSLLDTQRLLLEGKGAEGKLDEEKIMILNHKEAIRYLVDSARKLEITAKTICNIHYLLSDELIEKSYAGKPRDTGVRISGSTYIPSEDPKHLQQQLERIAKKAALIQDSYEQSFFLLVHLSYLQAFLDVNKRTARLCANIPLLVHNLVPLSFNDVDRDDYTSAIIAIYELHDVRPLIDIYVFSYLRTCALYDATVKTIGFNEVRVRYRPQRRALLREIILKNPRGTALKTRIAAEAKKSIPAKDRKAFIGHVYDDLREMDSSRIAGLGVTEEELNQWLKKNRR